MPPAPESNVKFAEMISKIAHELRSPLTSVKGFSATLVKRWDRFSDEQRLQFVETIHADAERMGRIVSEVLDLARLEAGRLELRRENVSFADLARDTVEDYKALPGADRVVIEAAEDVEVWADPERLRHVLGNLVENAIKFSDEGEIRVSARRNGPAAEIEIRDQGVGIEADRLPTVLSGPGPTGQRSGPSGTGLGLYLTKRLVEAHGGAIRIQSTVGEGTTVLVALPASPESASINTEAGTAR